VVLVYKAGPRRKFIPRKDPKVLRKNTFLGGSIAGSMALAMLAPSAASAQQAGKNASDASGTVQWTAAPLSLGKLPRDGRVTVVLRGAVKEGWHVYALKQPENGPTPLVVALEPNDFAKPAGAAQASPPAVAHDPSFNLDLPYYGGAFTVSLPLRLRGKGLRFALPVSVRFQTCNGRICQPPKTVHLSVPVEIGAAG
jgi:DsbC/DsbD-like thiol-disulfide interchange protein